MPTVAEVSCRMTSRRRVAATDMAALQAQPQVHPTVTHLQALFAALGVRSDLLDLIEMLAGLHVYPLQAHGPGERNREPYEKESKYAIR